MDELKCSLAGAFIMMLVYGTSCTPEKGTDILSQGVINISREELQDKI
jgi:hypothetical protein